MGQLTYVRFTPEVEVRQEHEDEDIAAVRETFAKTRAYSFEKHRHAQRGAHAKSHGILGGVLRVHDDLPDELRQGVFAPPMVYPVMARLSTSPGAVLPDGVAGLRGMGVKVIGVTGEQVLPELQGAATQDFVMANHPTIAAGDVHSYRRQSVLLDKATRQPEELQRITTTATRAGSAVLRRFGVDRAGFAGGLAKPQVHILGETYFSQAAMRYGSYVAKLQVAPVSASLEPLIGAHVKTGNPSVLRDLVSDFFRSQTAEYEVRVQLATDLDVMPVEDASVEWPEDVSPYRTVGTLTFGPQDPYSPARRVYGDDVLSFNPWHAVVEHQPLGSISRVRKPVYDDSAEDRHRLNVRTRVEPASIDELPV